MESEKAINIDVRCYNCHFCATFDSGYSNYTVEDTTIDCLLEKNPYMPANESYSWRYGDSETRDHETFKVAETCASYQFTTDLTSVDVEGEQLDHYKDDPVYHALLKKAYNGN